MAKSLWNVLACSENTSGSDRERHLVLDLLSLAEAVLSVSYPEGIHDGASPWEEMDTLKIALASEEISD